MLPPRTIRSVTKEGEAGVPPWIRIGTGSEKKGEKKKRRRRNVTTVIQRRGQGYNAFYHARRHAYFSLATHGNFDSTDQRRASSSVQRASALTSPILYNLGRASPQRRAARVTKFSFLLLIVRLFESFFLYSLFLSHLVFLFFLFIYFLVALVLLERVVQFQGKYDGGYFWRNY